MRSELQGPSGDLGSDACIAQLPQIADPTNPAGLVKKIRKCQIDPPTVSRKKSVSFFSSAFWTRLPSRCCQLAGECGVKAKFAAGAPRSDKTAVSAHLLLLSHLLRLPSRSHRTTARQHEVVKSILPCASISRSPRKATIQDVQSSKHVQARRGHQRSPRSGRIKTKRRLQCPPHNHSCVERPMQGNQQHEKATWPYELTLHASSSLTKFRSRTTSQRRLRWRTRLRFNAQLEHHSASKSLPCSQVCI